MLGALRRSMMNQTASLIQPFPYLGIFLLLTLGTLGLPFPEDTTLILGGFLMVQNVIQLFPALSVIYPTLLMTDFLLYWIGKRYGRRVVEHKIFRRILSPNRLLKLEEKFRKWGVWVVFFGRHLLGVRAQIFLAAGVMRMPARKFLFTDALSALITMAIMIGIGYWGGSQIQMLREGMARIKRMTVFFLILIVLGWSLFRYFRRKNIRLD
jgi:membrane protein DedA with SNARE-associated domain